MKQSKKAFIQHHVFCICMVSGIYFISVLLSLLLRNLGMNKEIVLMIYMIGVLLSTVVTSGYLYGFLTSLLSVFLFNYIFTDPVYSFAIGNSQDLFLIVFFLIAALICGLMSSSFKSQAIIAKKNAKIAQLMYEITERFLNLTGTEAIVESGMEYIYRNTRYPCTVRLDSLRFGPGKAEFCYPAYAESLEWIEKPCSMEIRGMTDKMGIVLFPSVQEFENEEEEKLVKNIIYHMALVLDREYIYLEQEKTELEIESERIKSTLIRSISHDIKTPLTGIISASGLIMDSEVDLDAEEVKRLASDINEQAWWLEATVQNILDMTKIMDGKLSAEMKYETVDDLINQAVSHVVTFADERRLKVFYPDGIFLLRVDGKLFSKVLINLLDNAFKHSGEQTHVELRAFKEGEEMVFQISDDGCGIDEVIYDRIFEDFVTSLEKESDKGRGVGLGLPICKAIITVLGGTIYAENQRTGGAVFTVRLPVVGGG